MTRRPSFVRAGMVAVATMMLASASALAGCNDSPPPPTPTRPPVAFAPVEVTGVGDIVQGEQSQPDLVLEFTETGPAAILRGPGSLQVTLTDHAGLPDPLQFTGVPVVAGPGSLGATATLNGGNLLTLDIVDSDLLNIELITISGLGILASTTAAIGAINAVVGGCAGSLAGCTVTNVLPSPGSIVAQ